MALPKYTAVFEVNQEDPVRSLRARFGAAKSSDERIEVLKDIEGVGICKK